MKIAPTVVRVSCDLGSSTGLMVKLPFMVKLPVLSMHLKRRSKIGRRLSGQRCAEEGERI